VAEYIYNLRNELIIRLIKEGYQVTVCGSGGSLAQSFKNMGCDFEELQVNRRGKNPFSDLRVFFQYLRIIKRQKPNVVLTYTIKPNIYASIVCRILKIPYINNVTGIAVTGSDGFLQNALFFMQKLALKKSACVFFQNEKNYSLYREKNIVNTQGRLIPGSGINLEKFKTVEYPAESGALKFVSIARIRKEKGFDELFTAIRAMEKNAAEFHVIGPCEVEAYIKELERLRQEGFPVIYHGGRTQEEVLDMIGECHCLIHPSHSEGMANVILESAATARPVIASDIPGCHEAVEEGVTGYLFECRNVAALIEKIERFMSLSWEQKRDMGLAGRRKMEAEFDRNIVIDAYMEEINKCTGEQK
jgi:galacturonosyltransferase